MRRLKITFLMVISVLFIVSIVVAETPKLVLYNAALTVVLTQGMPTKVTVAGVEYDVNLMGVADSDTIVVTVGSDTKSIDRFQVKTIGGLQVYVNDVYYYGSTRTDNQAKILFGSEMLTLEEGKKAYTTSVGVNTNIDGTYVDLTTDGAGKLTMIEIYAVGSKATVDVLKAAVHLLILYSRPSALTLQQQYQTSIAMINQN